MHDLAASQHLGKNTARSASGVCGRFQFQGYDVNWCRVSLWYTNLAFIPWIGASNTSLLLSNEILASTIVFHSRYIGSGLVAHFIKPLKLFRKITVMTVVIFYLNNRTISRTTSKRLYLVNRHLPGTNVWRETLRRCY